MKICISADSTCDLSPELVEKYHISIEPLYIIRDGKSLRDGIDITPQDIFQRVKDGLGISPTGAVNVSDYADYFRSLRENCDAVIHINISSDFSSCFQNASLAAQEIDGVYAVDSRNLSTGSGLLVLRAAEMAEQGMDPQSIVDALNQLAEKVEASFVIDTLEHLRIGGRCSTIAAFGASMLQLKPCIEVKEGKMSVGKKYRGQINKAIHQYVENRLKDRTDLDLSRIFVTHTCQTREPVEDAIATVKKLQPFAEILETQAGCTVSTHCGPNTLGVLFIRK